MRVIPLQPSGDVYTSNVYLVLGSWSRLDCVNTLVDVGRDPAVLQSLEGAPTGVGKNRVEQVVLTHGHYDHCSLLPVILELYRPSVLAFSHCVGGVTDLVADGDRLFLGDRRFTVIHTPGHTEDSICLFGEQEGVLFCGDTPLIINSPGGSYEPGFVRALERLCELDVRSIYFGHGKPLHEECGRRLRLSLENVRLSLGHGPPEPAGAAGIWSQARAAIEGAGWAWGRRTG
jgi:glyoxylase-like metal-dependent hydrolase (beta-lactamase superfamily II)